MSKIKPLCRVIACGIAVVLFVWGLAAFNPNVMRYATALLGLATVGLAAIRFSATRSLSTLLLGLTALWVLLGKLLLSQLTNIRVESGALTRLSAETWETYVVLAGALLLIGISLLLTPGPAEEAETEREGEE